MTGTASPEFQDQLTDFLPKMRIQALSLTRNSTAAEDLVQEVAMKVLMACDSYVPGTNFPGWVHRIMVNQFITNLRRQREYNDLEQMPEPGTRAVQEDLADLRELHVAIQRLPKDQREALRLIAVEELSYVGGGEIPRIDGDVAGYGPLSFCGEAAVVLATVKDARRRFAVAFGHP